MPQVLIMPMPAHAAAAALSSPAPEQLSLFDAGPDIAGLRIERAALASAGRAPSTLRAYASDWRAFLTWCASAGRIPLPATVDTLTLFLVDQARGGKAVATVQRRLSAIAARHRSEGHAPPCGADDVAEVMAGLRRQIGRPVAKKLAVGAVQLRAMVGSAGGRARRGVYTWARPGGEVLAVRDRALLLFGFASALRRSELSGLDLVDVDFVARGLVVRLGRSKTDQEGRGREIGIPFGLRLATCPVRALSAWVAERGGWPGPLFCAVGLRGAVQQRRLQPAGVAGVVKAAAKRCALDPARYAAHSLRAGCITTAVENRADAIAIKGRTGHKSTAVMEGYIRHGSLFAVDPLAGVL